MVDYPFWLLAFIFTFHQSQLLAVQIPATYGGVEASFMSLILTIEELSRADASVGLLCDLQNTVVSNVFWRYGTEAQRQAYLPRLCRDTIGSFCLTEPEAGSDAFALKTKADVAADKSYYTLNGEKMWISNVAHADVFLVMATVASFIKRDLSGMGKWLFVGALVLMVGGIVNVFVGSTAGMMALSVAAIGIFSAFMLYDLKRILVGGETNYISATLALYLDMFNIFQSLLALLGISSGERD